MTFLNQRLNHRIVEPPTSGRTKTYIRQADLAPKFTGKIECHDVSGGVRSPADLQTLLYLFSLVKGRS